MIQKILRKKKEQEKVPSRITNDTVAQHREKVLAGGRKLKYPLQYTRHKLVRNTLLISLAALVGLVGLLGLQLYVWKDTSDIAYRITRVLPLPVATIDGESVRYSDYLLYHRSTIAALEDQNVSLGNEKEERERLQFQQEQALERALEDAYANKIIKEHAITVTDEQVSTVVEQQRKDSQLSEGAYTAVVKDRLHWTMDELRQAIKNSLVRQEAAFAVDTQAEKMADQVTDQIRSGKGLADIANTLGDAVTYRADMLVPEDNSDGGLSVAAAKLEVGATSSATRTLSGDGYYFITRGESDKGFVRYSYIMVPLTTFKKDFDALKDSDKTKIFITIK